MPPALPSFPPLGEELIPPGEADHIRIVTDVCLEMMQVEQTPVPRQQHGKGHGVVRAELRIEGDVHPDLRHGLLATPGSVDAIIRFSNGGSPDDRQKDAHGLALKLLNVPGDKVLDDERDARTQDFIFMDHGTFFIRDAKEYAEFAATLRNGWRRSRSWWARLLPEKVRPLIIAVHLIRKYFRKHRAELGFFQGVRSAPPPSPLHSGYWSVTPARLGPHAVRWALKPRPEAAANSVDVTQFDRNDPERLRKVMVAQLAKDAFEFDVFVQRQTDAATMPVEDPTIGWDELVAPEYHVGTLYVPVQEFDTPRKRAIGDGLAFTVWHCLPAHRPLGGINRIRKAVYQATSARRRALNGQQNVEPGDNWLRDVWEGQATTATSTND